MLMQNTSREKMADTGLVMDKYEVLRHEYKKAGRTLDVPIAMRQPIKLFTEMAKRFLRGDARCSLEERQAEADVAQWMADAICDLRGKPHVNLKV